MRIFFPLICISLFLASCTLSGSSSNTGTNPPSGTTTTGPQSRIPSPEYGSGPHTLTVFADFQCPACIATNKVIAPIFEEYASKGYTKIVYKQFPLTSIHKNAERDALAGLCSAEQGKYMEYKKALYTLEEGKSGAKVTDEERVNAGNGILDTAKLAECLKGDRYLEQVRSEMREGDALGIDSTPTILLDGKKIDNSVFRDPVILRSLLDNWLGVPTPTATGSI